MAGVADRKRARLERQGERTRAGVPAQGGGDELGEAEKRALSVLIAAGSAVKGGDGDGVRYVITGSERSVTETLVMRAERLDLVRREEKLVVPTPAGIAWSRRRGAGGATAYRDQHGAVRRAGEGPAEELAESPLAWLHRRRDRDGRPLIGHAAFAAGERLRAHFTLGNLAPRMSIRWDGQPSAGPGGGGGELTETALAARQRVRRAMETVGPKLSGVLLDVCCFLKGMEEVEHDRRWPARSAKVILGLALARLARHYGLGDEAVGMRRPGRIEAARPGDQAA